MQEDDEASVVTFNHYATLKQNFAFDKEALRKAVSMMYASGGTDVNLGLVTALSTYDKHVCMKQKIIVLICGGDVNYVQSTIDRCIVGGIQIYAVNVGYRICAFPCVFEENGRPNRGENIIMRPLQIRLRRLLLKS